MNAAILTIGNELLAGFTVDTNSAWLGQRLTGRGINVQKKVSIADDTRAIQAELDSAIRDKMDFIILTGGLGPTHDDITVNAVSDYFGLSQKLDEDYLQELIQKFDKRGMSMPETNQNQAYVYNGSEVIPNPGGSARGLSIRKNSSSIFVLPGVPFEMKQMFRDTVEPLYLPEPEKKYTATLHSMGITETRLAENIQAAINRWQNKLIIAFLPSHLGVDVRLTVQPEDGVNLDEAINDFMDEMDKYFYGMDEEKLEGVVLTRLGSMGKTLAVAESCTGGNLARFITSIPGSSNVFLGGVVAYSNHLKTGVLSVSQAAIKKDGAVSANVAKQMASGIRAESGADIGIGITGISGPDGGSEEKPAGLVYIALADNKGVNCRRFVLIDKRILHQEMTSYVALDMIRRWCDAG